MTAGETEALAKAWDEGFEAADDYIREAEWSASAPKPANPYREESK